MIKREKLLVLSSLCFLAVFTNCAKDKGGSNTSGDAATTSASVITSIQAKSKSQILKAQGDLGVDPEEARFEFAIDGKQSPLSFDMSTDNFAGINWGSLKSSSDYSAVYIAPDYVPEYRKIEIIASNADVKASSYVHLLPSDYQGVPDDSQTRGVTAEFYRFNTPPTCNTTLGFPDVSAGTLNNRSIARDLNLSTTLSANNLLVGLTDLAANYAVRFSGVIAIDDDGTYVFSLPNATGLNTCRKFYFNDALVIDRIANAANSATAVGGTQSANLTLKAGKYPFVLQYYHTSASKYDLKLQWAKLTGSATRANLVYRTIPWSQFDPPASATQTTTNYIPGTASFVKLDTTTQGNWQGVYGAEGNALVMGTYAIPAYAQFVVNGGTEYSWANNTADVRALLFPTVNVRNATTWYNDTSFGFDIKISDGKSHQIAFYALDWDNGGRSQKIEIYDLKTGNVLDSRTVSGYQSGKYIVYTISGSVQVQFTKVTGANATISGVFFAP